MVLKVAVCPAILFASLSQYALPLWSYYVLVALVEDFHLGITAAKLEHSNRAMIAVKSFFREGTQTGTYSYIEFSSSEMSSTRPSNISTRHLSLSKSSGCFQCLAHTHP